MRNKRTLVTLSVAAACLWPAARVRAENPSPWIHIQVTEDGGKPSKVNVNLPLSLVQVALDLAPEKVLSHGRVKMGRCGHHDVSVSDLRRLWRELRDTGDAELVSVEEEDETVRITRDKGLVRIDVEDRSRDTAEAETVHIEVPVPVVDALLSGEGEELDFRSALEELKKLRGEIVRVQGGDETVRIWIDERN